LKSKKRKKLDILFRKLMRLENKDSNNTYNILAKIRFKDKIRKTLGKKTQFPSLPSVFK
jgi:hypothetical protein